MSDSNPFPTSTSIAGIPLSSYICNASGPRCTTLEELKALGNSGSAAIMMKSCTLEARDGNPEPRCAPLDFGFIQAMGLPNLGYREYVRFTHVLKGAFPNKPVIASVAGLCAEDFPIMVRSFQEESEADLIEVNLSCPNIPGKPQIAYDFEVIEEVLTSISGLGRKPIGLKLPAYLDRAYHQKIAALVVQYGISFISCINSIGSTLVIDSTRETSVIAANGGFGGLSGGYIKPIALANVRIFYELLHGTGVSIFGVGGIYNGRDALEFLLAGADAVQVGTQFIEEGPGCFARVDRELARFLACKGYASISDAKGKLQLL